MADIQLLGTSKISERVPGANVAPTGAVANALQQVGGQVEKFAGDLAEKQKAVEVKTYVLDSKINFEKEQEAMILDSRKKYAAANGGKGDNVGFQKEIQEKGDLLRKKYLDAAPYEDAKEHFGFDSQIALENTRIREDSRIRKEVAVLGNQKAMDYAVHTANQVQSNPTDPSNMLMIQDAIATVDDPDLEMDPIERRKNVDRAKATLRDGLLNGYISKANEMGVNGNMVQEKEFLRKGRKLLDSDDEFFKGMPPDERLKQELRFEQGLKQSRDRSFKHTASRVESFVTAGAPDELLPGIKQQILSNPNTDQFEKERDLVKVVSANAATKIKAIVGLVPEEEQDVKGAVSSIIKSTQASDPYITKAAAAMLEKDLVAQVQKDREDLPKDPGGYFAERDKAVQGLGVKAMGGSPESYDELKRELNTYYDRFKVRPGNRNYTTPVMRQHFKKSFQQSIENREYQAATESLNDIVEMAGPDTYRVMVESEIDPKYAVIGLVPDTATRTKMLSNMTTFDSDSPKTKALMGKPMNERRVDWNNTDLIKAVRQSGDGGPKAQEMADAMVDQIQFEFVAQVNKNVEKGVAKQSAMNIFKNHYETTKVSRSTVYFPQSVPAQKAAVTQFLDTFQDEDIDYVEVLGLSDNGNKAQTNADIRDRGEWNNVDPTKIELTVVKDGIRTRLQKKDGAPPQWDMQQILNFPTQRVLNESRKKASEQMLGRQMKKRVMAGEDLSGAGARKFFQNLFGGNG